MKKIKYVILIIILLFSFIVRSNAAQNSMNGSGFTSNVYMPTQMDFYDLTSVNTGIKKTNTACYGDYCSVDSMAVGPTQWGAAVTFDTNTLFKDGFLYSINVYLGYMSTDGNCYDWAYFNNYTPRLTIATDISATYERFNQNIASNIISYAHSYGSFKIRPNDTTGNNFCSGRMSFLFVPQTGGNSVFVPFLSTYTHYDWVFYGYEVQGYGQYSTLSQSDISGIQSSLQTSINDSTVAINNINSSTTDIKQNMEQFTNSINNTIIQKENETQQKVDKIDDAINSDDEDTESGSCGIICKLKGIFTGIIELPKKLVNLLIDALKSLFIPTDEQLQEIIDDTSDLSEDFGFVGESTAFFIRIFTSFAGLVNHNGCITLPAFSIGKTSLFDAHTFWEEQQVCLSNNKIISDNIEQIRTITSIGLVCMFITFSARQFFSILSKETEDKIGDDSQ